MEFRSGERNMHLLFSGLDWIFTQKGVMCKPNSVIWKLWKNQKSELKAEGYFIFKNDNDYGRWTLFIKYENIDEDMKLYFEENAKCKDPEENTEMGGNNINRNTIEGNKIPEDDIPF